MGLLDIFRHNKIKEPIFYNEHDDKRLETLEDLLNKVGDDQKQLILNEINLIRIGLSGEKNVIYELMHSNEPIVFLHDISLPNVMTDSQIDFIVISRKCIFVLETKKLSGDVKIDNEGNFTRYLKNSKGETYNKVGIYSPITQNRYHVDAIKKLLIDNKYPKNLPILSLVVIANPKSIVDKKYAKSDVKKQVVKYDQLNSIISQTINNYNDIDISDKVMLEIAELIYNNDTEKSIDYVEKLKLNLIEEKENLNDEVFLENKDINSNNIKESDFDQVEDNVQSKDDKPLLNDELYEKLRKYRYDKSIKLKIKPFQVFTDVVLEQLILIKPRNKDEFISINGLGESKFESFGNEIINIIYPDINLIENNNINRDSIKDKDTLINELKKYRILKANEEGVPLYFIFNNQEMENLIEKMPSTYEALFEVKGFGKVKIEKYGKDILEILNR